MIVKTITNAQWDNTLVTHFMNTVLTFPEVSTVDFTLAHVHMVLMTVMHWPRVHHRMPLEDMTALALTDIKEMLSKKIVISMLSPAI